MLLPEGVCFQHFSDVLGVCGEAQPVLLEPLTHDTSVCGSAQSRKAGHENRALLRVKGRLS